ncbi:unnamed protein product [Effrenium voratum]|nr:unnamed protein product [Effrenium voratum]
MAKVVLALLEVATLSHAYGPWVKCLGWNTANQSTAVPLGNIDSCQCQEVAQVSVSTATAAEGCAAEAVLWRRHPTWIAFHIFPAKSETRCVVERCDGRCGGAEVHACEDCIWDSAGGSNFARPDAKLFAGLPQVAKCVRREQVVSYVPRALCPDGMAAILPELGALSEDGGLLPAETAETEFVRLFGPLRLQGQMFQTMQTECSATAHRAVAKICFGDECDEWSKYSLPRCHVSLGLPYEFGDSNFLYAPACERTQQFYCPPGLPVALQLTLKAGSRSATVWAAMLEGLMPAVVSARRTLAVAMSGSAAGYSRVARYAQEWLEHEEMRLGCSPDLALFSISRGLHMLSDGRVGLPMGLCPTCCRTGAGRLRVVFVRSPLARLSSFFHGYWFPQKGHLLKEETSQFQQWVRLILSPVASASPLFEASDLDHVRPAFTESLSDKHVVFCIEDVAGSLRRVETALCKRFGHCTPLPSFPAVRSKPAKFEQLAPDVEQLLKSRFHHDFLALASCGM